MDSSSNDKEVVRIGSDTIKCKTAAGAAYVAKVLHPPSNKTPQFRGVPDCSAPNVTHLELKAEDNFPPILTLPTGTTAVETINTSSMLFLQSSGNSTAVYCFLGSGMDWIQPFGQEAIAGVRPALDQVCKPASRFAGYNFSKFTLDCATKRTTYKSTTYYLNATGFNNQGTVTTAKFKPQIFGKQGLNTYYDQVTDEEVLSMHRALPPKWRDHIEDHIRSNKKAGTEADLYRFAAKHLRSIGYNYDVQILFVGSTGVIQDIPNSKMARLTNVLPQSAGAVLQLSPKSVSAPAKDGAFVVLQPADPVQTWTNSMDTTINIPPVQGVNDGLLASFIKTGQGANSMIASLLSYPSTPASSHDAIASSLEVVWDNLDWSITLFEGLTVPPAVGRTLTSVPYITTKSFVGIECQPSLNSSWLPFLECLPLPDPDALEMATGVFHSRPDALPASANDLGTIASTVLKYIPAAVSWLKDLFGSKQQKNTAMVAAQKFVKPPNKPKPKPAVNKPAPGMRRSRSMTMRTPLPYENSTYTAPKKSRSKSRSKSRNRKSSNKPPKRTQFRPNWV